MTKKKEMGTDSYFRSEKSLNVRGQLSKQLLSAWFLFTIKTQNDAKSLHLLRV